MNILITGELAALSVCLAQRFSKEGHKVVLAGTHHVAAMDNLPRVSFHSIAADDVLFEKALSRYKFDGLVFLGTREENQDRDSRLQSGRMLDGLQNALSLAKNENLDHFFFISSTEVFGDAVKTSGDDEPDPLTFNGFALVSAEKICQRYQEIYNLTVTILRLPHIYGLVPGNVLMARLLDAFIDKSTVKINGDEETKINLLHCADVADCLLLAFDDPKKGALRRFNLSSADTITMGDLVDRVSKFFPSVSVSYETPGNIYTRPVAYDRVKSALGWIPKRTLARELPEIITAKLEEKSRKKSLWQRISQGLAVVSPAVRWIELVLGGVAVYFLNQLSGTILQFRYIDFRLLFVILLGSTYGTGFGFLAAVVASGLALLNWYQMGLNFSMLVYNIENWIPFALYLLAGGITGYLHDKHENETRFQEEQVRLVQEKYKFLYGVYDEISSIKDQFREQLMSYRDSFGRIYSITTQLNSLQEEDIMLRAVEVLEDVLDNKSIAIYSIDENQSFGRLQVCSRTMNTTLPKSIRMSEFPEVLSKLDLGDVYQNKKAKTGYPAYFAPVLDQDRLVAGVALWDVNFDQYSLQYYNLIKVITGLIESALVRAARFKLVNAANTYLPNTRILKPEAFKEILRTKREMKTSQVAQFEVIRVLTEFENWEVGSQQIEVGIRTTDYIGLLDDGQCYILLSQTDWMNAFNVLTRLNKLGIKGEILIEVTFDE